MKAVTRNIEVVVTSALRRRPVVAGKQLFLLGLYDLDHQ